MEVVVEMMEAIETPEGDDGVLLLVHVLLQQLHRHLHLRLHRHLQLQLPLHLPPPPPLPFHLLRSLRGGGGLHVCYLG